MCVGVKGCMPPKVVHEKGCLSIFFLFLSRHVVFYENMFPFHNKETSMLQNSNSQIHLPTLERNRPSRPTGPYGLAYDRSGQGRLVGRIKARLRHKKQAYDNSQARHRL
ncbi:hypothetical protein MTR_5g034260 [Medicago truncatula]|uniref:Uncharacterized protein n=1 Tax=Medicago truncatula TaxID=3880 RepID=G7K1D5_MEDTR|nr:hypothetical protein MTR_5g034260 [Medicago truncatula]